ncbi:heterokaryon incompatibility protein-domain-containing protein [Apiospora arundinis]
MRILDTSTLALITKNDNDLPPYAILSHTWVKDEEEVTFGDSKHLMAYQSVHSSWLGRSIRQKAGFSKVRESAALAKADGNGYIWIDICCIDKSSSAELSEAINSMFRYYHDSAVCYVYLIDVETNMSTEDSREEDLDETFEEELEESLRRSRWFTRGWTLQELVAPGTVEFYTTAWQLIGTKAEGRSTKHMPQDADLILPHLLIRITGIPISALESGSRLTLSQFSIAQRMSWASRRETTKIEDAAYCLMGIFDINMPLL